MSKRVMFTSCVLISTLLIMIASVVVGEGSGSGPIDANAIRHGYRPVLKYTVASPRACLINPTNHTFDRCPRPRGDADNFPRRDGSVRVFVGTRVVFCLSRDIEGVWYTGSRMYGQFADTPAPHTLPLYGPGKLRVPQTGPQQHGCEVHLRELPASWHGLLPDTRR